MHSHSRFYLESHHILVALGYKSFNLLLGKSERVAHLHSSARIILEILYLTALGLQFLGSVECYIRLAGIEQLVHIFLVDVATFALSVRPVVASKGYTLVKLYTEPFERFYDILLGSGHKPGRVCVLDSKHQFAPMLAGKQIVVEGSPDASDMQCPCGAWCESHPYFSFCHNDQII